MKKITTRNYRTYLMNLAFRTQNWGLLDMAKTMTGKELVKKFAENFML